jgi:hypothetical protein
MIYQGNVVTTYGTCAQCGARIYRQSDYSIGSDVCGVCDSYQYKKYSRDWCVRCFAKLSRLEKQREKTTGNQCCLACFPNELG